MLILKRFIMKKKLVDNLKKTYSDFFGWNPPMIFVFTVLSIFVLFVSLVYFRLDNDFWFLINHGRYILNNAEYIPTNW